MTGHQQSQPPTPEFERAALWLAFGWVGVSVVLIGRFWSELRAPRLFAEDGSVLFSRHWDAGSVEGALEIFAKFQGYASVLPNAAAWLLCRLPSESIPSAFVAAALAAYAVPFLLLASPLVKGWLPDPRVRALVAVSGAAASIANVKVCTLLIYAQWPLFAAAALLLLAPAGSSRVALWGRSVALVGCACTGPLVAALLPVAAVRAFLPQRVPALAFVVVGVLYLLLGLDRDYVLVVAGLEIERPLDITEGCFGAFPLLLGRCVTGLFSRSLVVSDPSLAVGVGGGVLAAVLAVALVPWHRGRSSGARGSLDVGLLGMVVIACAALAVAIAGHPDDSIREKYGIAVRALLDNDSGERFLFVPRFALWVVVAALLGHSSWPWRRWWCGIALASVFVGGTWVAQTSVIGDAQVFPNRYHEADLVPGEADSVARLMRELESKERAEGGRSAVQATLPRPVGGLADFSIRID